MAKIKPLFNNVLIELIDEKEEKTQSGIILPDTAEKKKQSHGIVKEVGPGKISNEGENIKMSVKAGDKVIFKKPWSDENKIIEDKKEYFIVEENDILATIN
ncbi:MAG: co-chaperone GroES [Candidatus Paceibacterota bacterium]